MKFSTREDIETPADMVFDALSDFAGFERAALRRGADVSRQDMQAATGAGLRWSLRIPIRGKMREVECELTEFDRPTRIALKGNSTGYDIDVALTLVALSRARTRLGVEFELRPKKLSARLMLQSVRLNKAAYARRFEVRIQKFATDLERRFARQGSA